MIEKVVVIINLSYYKFNMKYYEIVAYQVDGIPTVWYTNLTLNKAKKLLDDLENDEETENYQFEIIEMK